MDPTDVLDRPTEDFERGDLPGPTESDIETEPVETAADTEPTSKTPADGCQNVDARDDYIARVGESHATVRGRKNDYDRLHEQTKEAKKAWEGAVAELGSVIEAGVEHLPLFDGPQAVGAAVDAALGVSAENWRSVTTEQLGIPDAICKSLRENPEAAIARLGQIADWTTAHELIDIPGIGQAKAEKIQEGCDRYWEAHPGQVPKPETTGEEAA